MQYLLVDDRDGRIVAELENEEEALRVLEVMAQDARVPEYLCLVEFRSKQGSVLGTDTDCEDPNSALARDPGCVLIVRGVSPSPATWKHFGAWTDVFPATRRVGLVAH